jgi:hypothetical protein
MRRERKMMLGDALNVDFTLDTTMLFLVGIRFKLIDIFCLSMSF